MMAARTEPTDQSEAAEGNVLSHLLVGDFDQYAWKKKTDESFHEWTGDGGMWELSDPTAPTHKKGPKLEKKTRYQRTPAPRYEQTGGMVASWVQRMGGGGGC